MTIVKNIGVYTDYEFLAIRPDALAAFTLASSRLKPYVAIKAKRSLKLLECFLQITDGILDCETIADDRFNSLSTNFFGALYSAEFIEANPVNRYEYAKAYNDLAIAARKAINNQNPLLLPSLLYYETSNEVYACVHKFDALPKNKDKIVLWTAWPTTNKKNETCWLSLYHIHARLGTLFTDRLYKACDLYYSARKGTKVPGIRALNSFMREYVGDIAPGDFDSPTFVTNFLRRFFEFYINEGSSDQKQSSIEFLVTYWKQSFLPFLEEYLIAGRIFAKPFSVPSPKNRMVHGSRTNVRKSKSGLEIKTKLLTPVPLELSDSAAMQLLMEEIKTDFNTIVKWVRHEIADLRFRHERRLNLQKIGQVRRVQRLGGNDGSGWLNDPRNPECLANGAATYAFHGHQTDRDQKLKLLYAQPLANTAYELGLSTRFALLPHAILLAAEHPCLTESMLVECELFDKNGKQTALVETDGGARFVAYKARRGNELAQIVVNLTPETEQVVRQVIQVTQPLRDYLKKMNDPNWRYLFLSSGKSFGYPKKCSFSMPLSTESIYSDILERFSVGAEITLGYAEKLLKNISVTSVRATAGTMEYLKTGSAERMSRALGHSEYSPKLLCRYLPEPIFGYFQERWIRIFQTGIVVEALKDSEFLLEASGFTSMEQLNMFLQHHALDILPDHVSNAPNEGGMPKALIGGEVLIGVNVAILTLLLSLEQAVARATKTVTTEAKNWAELSAQVAAYIEQEAPDRPDLLEYLKIAREKLNPGPMDEFIYG